MLVSRRIFLALGVLCVSLAMLVSAAWAGEPATVTVRVEGQNATLLAPTQVTTTTSPVVKDGKPEDSCPGTSALGALQVATGGAWSGPWDESFKQYEVFSIENESHEFGSGFFWELWVEHKASQTGACEAELSPSSKEVLFYPCSETASECPSPLGIEVPTSANVGESVVVKVVKYSAAGESSAVSGATISGTGEEVTTGANGNATLKFPSPGETTVRVSAPELVRTEATICVHNGNDGTCGTTAPTTSSTSTSTSGTTTPATGVAGFAKSAPYTGPYALVARATDLIEDHTYGPTNAPRVLSGTVLAHSAVSSISLQLRRRYKGRCFAYNGTRERFVAARCGQGSYFKVSTSASYSYLLPAALPPGRYVLDIRATDASGNHTTLARGSSRIVFYVR